MSPLVLLLLAVEPHRLDSRREPGAESCPDEAALQRAVAERLGQAPFSPDATRTVTVRWRFDAAAYTSNVTVTDGTGAVVGTKKLTSTGKDCGELAASTALALSLILDPMSLTRPAPEPPTPLEPPPPPPSDDIPPPPPLVVMVEPAPATHQAPPQPLSAFWLGGGAGVSVAEVPQVSAAVHLDLAGRWRWVMLGARVSFTVPGSKSFAEGSVSGTVVGVGPWLCLGSTRVGGCTQVRLGATHVWATGFAAPSYSYTLPSLAWSLGPYLDFRPLESLTLRLWANAQLQPTTVSLVVRTDVAWETPFIAFTAGVSFFGRP